MAEQPRTQESTQPQPYLSHGLILPQLSLVSIPQISTKSQPSCYMIVTIEEYTLPLSAPDTPRGLRTRSGY